MTYTTDASTFTLPPAVARMDAVRKLTGKLTSTTGIGDTAAETIAHAVVDPAAARHILDGPLPGLTAHREAHLQVIPTRVWTPFVTPAADEMMRYASQKRYPVANPSIPVTPRGTETADGLTFEWKHPVDRQWHLDDNENIYGNDIHTSTLRLFPEMGGIITPVVLAPQTETFQDGSDALHLLRLVDGQRRYYEAMNMIRQFANLDQERLAAHLGPDVTPEIFRNAMERDRKALTKVINAVRTACSDATEGMGPVHYLASCLSMPAWIAIGTTDPRTGEVARMGSGGGRGMAGALNIGMLRWHSGTPASLIDSGRTARNGLLIPSASIDDTMLDSITHRLRARGVAKSAAEFGKNPEVRPAARFVWWCRAVEQLGGTPATAVAAFALNSEGPWPQSISRSMLACASHLMEEDRDTLYPSGDYRDAEARPDSLTWLVADAENLEGVATMSAADARGEVLLHPRFRNVEHIALAHLALSGALPAQDPLPDRITGHVRLLSSVALCWARMQVAHFVTPDGEVHRENGRPVAIDERTLTRNDLPWPGKAPQVDYLMPPKGGHPYAATHVFTLKHGVIYTIPDEQLREDEIEATPEALARVVHRWFPDATGITLTDWSDKFITGVMVGSVWVRLDDRKGEREDGRTRGVWYPEGAPDGTKDVLDFESADSGLPVGFLYGAAEFLYLADDGSADMGLVEGICHEELTDVILTEVDDALEFQRKRDERDQGSHLRSRQIPVLRLPDLKR